jgi:hypothetical protein
MTYKMLVCGCGKEFQWSVKSQLFFAHMEWPAPRRCKKCKAERDEHFAAKNAPKIKQELSGNGYVNLESLKAKVFKS